MINFLDIAYPDKPMDPIPSTGLDQNTIVIISISAAVVIIVGIVSAVLIKNREKKGE